MGPPNSRSDGTGRGKVHSRLGCRTCKTRKVKCDEGRPACHRCVSTGRVCDGYGVWGNGDSYSSRRMVPRPPVALFLSVSNPSEKEHFEWFKCRVSIKLPGTFNSSFWNTLLFQASLNEPAVLNAVLALSSVHKRGVTDSHVKEGEKFALNHYVKAISCLQPHFSNKDRSSFRIALITCVVFVSLEFLRGHFSTAQLHLQNGLRILGEMQDLTINKDGIGRLKPSRESTDDWITEAFSRLYLMVGLFKQPFQHTGLTLQLSNNETSSPYKFNTINEAWMQLEQIFSRIFQLTHQGRQERLDQLNLLETQKRIRADLSQWLLTYELFLKCLPPIKTVEEQKAYPVVQTYHSMALIMLNTCLDSHNELIFDSQTSHFLLLLNQLLRLWQIALAATPEHVRSQRRSKGMIFDMASSMIDVGWIPPLYYIAIKCRIHRIRMQAVRLLESTSHREGIWDSKISACAAKKVVELEERGVYDGVIFDNFGLDTELNTQDLEVETIPEGCRLRDVETVLEGSPVDRILLFGRETDEYGSDCRVLVAEYDGSLQRWIFQR